MIMRILLSAAAFLVVAVAANNESNASNETGDCDTRSLLAFTILREFGYDVAVVNSIKMGHSMLGVHVPYVPGNGVYGLTSISRKRYYLWELTATGWHLGDNYSFASDDWWVIYQ